MSYSHLTIEKRYHINAYKSAGYKNNAIAKKLNEMELPTSMVTCFNEDWSLNNDIKNNTYQAKQERF